MKVIVHKTDTGVAITSPHTLTITRLVALLMQQSPKISQEEAFDLAMETIAEKDIPRILPPEKQELRAKGKMSLKEYLTYPIPEYKIVDDSEFDPDYQNFKEARTFDLTLDIPKTKEIHKNRLREERKELFVQNDVLLNEGLLYNDQSKIEAGKAEKERLQNIPQLVDSAKTIKEIKAITVNS